MICNVLCVGTELLLGQIIDTNSTFIADQLVNAGIESYEHRRVGDNINRIIFAIDELLKTSDALIITGGLGPTHDDLSRDALAKYLDVELVYDDNVIASMKQFFKERQRDMVDSNLRQALVPVGATTIENHLGTAPGLIAEVNGKKIYLVPGVPHEMEPMVIETIIPDMQSHMTDHAIVTRTLKVWGYSESYLAQLLDEIVQSGETDSVKVGFLARGMNGIYVKLSVSSQTQSQAQEQIEPVEKQVREILGNKIFAVDDQTMESVVIDLLRERDLTIATAESFTGGMISSRLVNVSGASDVHKGSVVSYQEDIKRKVLGVQQKDIYTLDCAKEMATGVRELFGSDIAISTTGVAGPSGDMGHNPGEVYIGISTDTDTIASKLFIGGDRQRIREYSTTSALDLLRCYLCGYDVI